MAYTVRTDGSPAVGDSLVGPDTGDASGNTGKESPKGTDHGLTVGHIGRLMAPIRDMRGRVAGLEKHGIPLIYIDMEAAELAAGLGFTDSSGMITQPEIRDDPARLTKPGSGTTIGAATDEETLAYMAKAATDTSEQVVYPDKQGGSFGCFLTFDERGVIVPANARYNVWEAEAGDLNAAIRPLAADDATGTAISSKSPTLKAVRARDGLWFRNDGTLIRTRGTLVAGEMGEPETWATYVDRYVTETNVEILDGLLANRLREYADGAGVIRVSAEQTAAARAALVAAGYPGGLLSLPTGWGTELSSLVFVKDECGDDLFNRLEMLVADPEAAPVRMLEVAFPHTTGNPRILRLVPSFVDPELHSVVMHAIDMPGGHNSYQFLLCLNGKWVEKDNIMLEIIPTNPNVFDILQGTEFVKCNLLAYVDGSEPAQSDGIDVFTGVPANCTMHYIPAHITANVLNGVDRMTFVSKGNPATRLTVDMGSTISPGDGSIIRRSKPFSVPKTEDPAGATEVWILEMRCFNASLGGDPDHHDASFIWRKMYPQ